MQDFDPARDLGEPGAYPFTRGVYPTMYLRRPWTMRQYAGFSTAAESNRRYHQLIAAGTTGLSVAFDLPTQMGYDSDAPQAHGEVGKVGVAIDSIEDMRTLLRRHPAGLGVDVDDDQRAGGGPAAAVPAGRPRSRASAPAKLTGTIQNDILKEYIARGTYIYPPRPSLRLVADTFAYCRAEIPRWNTISISGYHMAEAGATPVQEIAFTLANAKEYVRTAIEAGLAVDEFAPRLSFFFVARTTLLEEVAKFRAARRLWARIMREEFGARDPRSQMLRFHTQTAGVQLTAQQPEVNLVRVTVQALAAVLGGTQSLHTNSYDEAIALPTEKAARLALRTQQVLAYETDLTATVDPFAGSYAIESMTDDIEAAARELMRGSRSSAARSRRSSRASRRPRSSGRPTTIAQQIDGASGWWSGVNEFVTAATRSRTSRCASTRRSSRSRPTRLAELRADRDARRGRPRRSASCRRPRGGPDNVLYPMREALRARATVGEVCDALRDVWGTYRPADVG